MKKGWEIKNLSAVCENLDNKRIPITKHKRSEGKYPYYGASGIVDYVEDFLFDEELLLVSEDGANLLARVYPIAFPVAGKCWVNNHAHVLRFENMTNQCFVEYYLNSIKLDDYVSGMAQPKLNQQMLNSIKIPIPSFQEQQNIISILNKTFASLEQAKENVQRNLQNAKELFQSELNNIFTSKGVGWVEKKLGEWGTITSSKRIYKSEYVSEGIPFYRTKEIKELSNGKEISLELFISQERYYEIKKTFGVPQIGDVLLSAVGTIGEILVVENDDEFYFKDGNIVWLKEFKNVDSFYLKYALTAFVEEIKKLSIGSAYNALTIEKLNEHKVSIPSLEEQKKIVAQLDTLSTETKNLENIYQQKLNALEELKKSILQKAFNGELAEPSGELTTKIKEVSA